ncbi:unnamed protein product [Nezara viridula]|uniref:Uncharacterized protein n=1 Tax=Nezara viridula TaxID=85310 RepID=A0A9P0GWU6_NEZVI|nr:unnamed protein product [Nezara viridula]
MDYISAPVAPCQPAASPIDSWAGGQWGCSSLVPGTKNLRPSSTPGPGEDEDGRPTRSGLQPGYIYIQNQKPCRPDLLINTDSFTQVALHKQHLLHLDRSIYKQQVLP